MVDYISRPALMGKLTSSETQQNIKAMLGADAYNEFLTMVNGTMKADVAPVRHGRWLNVVETDLYVPDHKFTMTKTAETCSECKARIGFVGAKLYLFDGICPNCGARMDGGADNGESV